MAYQNPAFYFYHALRDSQDIVTTPGSTQADQTPLYDSRIGALFQWDAAIGTVAVPSNKSVTFQLSGTGTYNQLNDSSFAADPAAAAMDTCIIAGHNIGGMEITAFTQYDAVDLYSPNTPIDVATNGQIVILPFTQGRTIPANTERLSFTIRPNDDTYAAVIPEISELWFTQERELTRGPEPNWNHPYRTTQKRFESVGGVSSTWMTGPARKTYRLTWRHLFGADRQIFLDMKEQTDDFSQPFFFRPPDDAYPTILVELDRDAGWTQDFMDPLISGTSDQITLPLIEVLG